MRLVGLFSALLILFVFKALPDALQLLLMTLGCEMVPASRALAATEPRFSESGVARGGPVGTDSGSAGGPVASPRAALPGASANARLFPRN